MTDAVTPTGPITRGSVARVGAATVVTALCGYAVLYLAARDLAPAGFSVFSVFWGAFGLVSGAANGLLQEATREVRSTGYVEVASGPRTHPMRVAAMVGVVAAALITGTSPLWSRHVFVESPHLSVALLSAGLAGFCLHATLLGVLAGVNRWTQYGSLMVADAAIRSPPDGGATSGCTKVSPATRSGCGRSTAVTAAPRSSPATTTTG